MLRDVGMAFLLSRAVFYITAMFATAFIPALTTPGAPTELIGVSWQWDGLWYLSIITDGYSWDPTTRSNVAFFPLFPVLVDLVAQAFPSASVFTVGVVVNHVVFFAALVAVWFYAEERAGRDVAGRTVLLLSLFPTAFFFSAAYSESIFLLACAASLALMHRRRFFWAGVAGLFASLARPVGVLLLVPYVLKLWEEKDGEPRVAEWIPKIAPGALILVGIGFYALYLGTRVGDPLAFSKAQQAWGREMTFPLLALGRATVAMVAPQTHALPFYMNILNVVFSIGGLALAGAMWKWDRPGGAFVVLALLAYLTYPVGPGFAAWEPWQGNSIQSMSRYAVTLFPAFVPIARWAAQPARLATVCAGFVALQVMLAALFMRGHYVF